MKKTLSLILVLVLVLSSIPAFADTASYGVMLFDLGLVKGDENGDLNEAMTITRAEMMVVLSRMYGVENEAMSYQIKSNFIDVASNQWFAPYVSYAQVKGWSKGYGNGRFGPMDTLTADMAATLLLRTLGYNDPNDFSFENAFEFADQIGIDVDLKVKDEIAITRAEVFELMFDTLNSETVDGLVLGEKLGVFASSIVDELLVTDIKILNLKEVVVSFNIQLDKDSAEETDNFRIEDHDLSVELADKGKSVLITLDDSFDNQEEFELEIDGVMSRDESMTIEDFTSDTLMAFDSTIPVALGVVLTGPDTFDINFSEPVQDKYGDFEVEVENGVYGVSDVEFDGSTVSVTLGSNLKEANYKVTVKGAYDFAGFKMLSKTFTLKYVIDNKAPLVVMDSANETEVVLKFNEKVLFFNEDDDELFKDDDEILDFFYHSYSAYKPDSIEIDDEEVTLKFESKPLPEGRVRLVVDFNANDGSIKDAWGNAISKDIVMYANVAIDDVAPVVDKLVTDDFAQDEFAIYFNESLNMENGEKIYGKYINDYVNVMDKDGDELDIDFLQYVVDDDEYYILVDMDEDIEGSYTLTVEGFKDNSLLENEMKKVKLTLVKADDTAPYLSDIKAEFVQDDEDAIIYIMFPEEMATNGSYSILNSDNYLIEAEEIDLKDDTIGLFGGADMVKIVMKDTVLSVGDKIEFSRMADAAGNKSVEIYSRTLLTEVTPPVVMEVTTISKKYLEITVDGKLSTVVADGFEIVNKGVTDTFASVSFVYDSDDDETLIKGTLKSTTQLTDPSDLPEYFNVVANKIKDDKGQYMLAMTISGSEFIKDGYSPTFDKERFEEDYDFEMKKTDVLYLYFDETIKYVKDYATVDLKIKVGGDKVAAFNDYTVEIVDDYLKVLFKEGTLTVGDSVNIIVQDAKYIVDNAGNSINDFEMTLKVVK